MSHFYATIKGSRGEANRCGTANSGISGDIRGWNVGAKVEVSREKKTNVYCETEEFDLVRVYKTKGSNGVGLELIAEFSE